MGHPLWAEGRGGAKPGSVGAGVPCRGQEGVAVQALNTCPELWGCRHQAPQVMSAEQGSRSAVLRAAGSCQELQRGGGTVEGPVCWL